ncbi:MAG TPA: SpoIIE family protein phosphatase [Streptosporangiaceae bacterium]|jgi:serine phosphatase RsbU (regulator of sigma subunit)|nr:SpoIIE family protein phosphatase [Streptosporangiaceae bacterium]
MLTHAETGAFAPSANENEQVEMVAEGVSSGGMVQAALPEPAPAERIRVLLIEDDDGDALLVEELLLDAGEPFVMTRVRSLADARSLASGAGCVLLDLELPDSRGLQGVRWLQDLWPNLAVVVLTGLSDEHLGEEAVAAGAQDYLVKGQVDGFLLQRVVRYAVERQRAEETQRQLREARLYAAENSRLERGLLPSPVLTDRRLTVASRYRSGGQQMLLGGDFYDVVEAPDGWVHAMVGDVCGRGPDEAALGVCLRVAWRTMILAGRPVDETLSAVQQVLEHERHHDRLFATLCMLSVAPDRTRGYLRLAGHPQPLLITADGVRELEAPVGLPPGITHSTEWPSAEVKLGDTWSVLMYTDGLIEGKIGAGPERLGSDGLIRLIEKERAQHSAGAPPDRPASELLIDSVITRARELNGGELDDDLAVLAVSCAPAGP